MNINIITAYRRIKAAAEKGTGVRLSAQEVICIWTLDAAISGAVDAEDMRLQDEKEEQGENKP